MVKRKTTADALQAGGASVGSLRVAVDAIYSDLAAKKAELEAQRAENLRARRRLADAEAALAQLQAEQDAGLLGDVGGGGGGNGNGFSTSADDVARLRKRCAALKIENRRLRDVEADAQAALASNRQLRRDNEALEARAAAAETAASSARAWLRAEREANARAFDELSEILIDGDPLMREAVDGPQPPAKRGPGRGRKKALKVAVDSPTPTAAKLKKSVTPSPTAAAVVAPSPSPSVEPKKRGASVSPRAAPPAKEDAPDDDESVSIDDESDEDYVPGREAKKRGKPAAVEGPPTKRRRAAPIDEPEEGIPKREHEMIALVHEMDASNAWDEVFAKRPTFSLTFDYEQLAPTAKEWVDNALQFHYDHRRAFWERTHWVTMERNFCGQLMKSLYRERLSRRTEAVRTWKELVKDGCALIDQGLLPENVWREPFWWGWPQAPNMLPTYIKTMKDIAELDERQPQRVVCVNDITEEPYYKELVESGCATRYPLPDLPNTGTSS